MTETNSITKVTNVKQLAVSDKFKEQIGEALPGSITLKRFMRCLYTSLQKTPKLMNCSPDSVRAAAITCAQMGVEPNGRDAHLIPYGNACTLIVDYKGLVRLALQSGEISNIHSDVVCDNDTFKYNKGRIESHEIDYRKPRGNVYAVYALANFKDGTEKAEVMHLDEVESIRKRSRASGSGPWQTDYNEMAKKTALRRLSKWLPLSPDIQDRIVAEDSLTDVDDEPDLPKPTFMQNVTPVENDEDDVPMDFEPVEEPKPEPAPKKKKAAKKAAKKVEPEPEPEQNETLFPEPHGQMQQILKLASADGVTEQQIAAFAEDRDIDLTDVEICSKIADSWSNIADDLKEF
jgi:recombination protein RecT